MDEPKEIVKTNIDRYNKKLVFLDTILIVSLLFILINYFLVIEPSYNSHRKLLFRTEKIQIKKNNIQDYKRSIYSKIPVLNDSDFKNEVVLEKLNSYLHSNQIASELFDNVQSKLNDIESANREIDTLTTKNNDLKDKISRSNDALSLIKILLFINDGKTHFALFLSFVVLVVLFYFYLTRRYLLNLLTRTLRIQKEKISLNEYFEYSLNYSIWLSPIPRRVSYSISKDELLNALSIKNNHNWYNVIMIIVFLLLTSLQLRLYFIELSINKLTLGTSGFFTLLNCIATIIVCYLWLSRNLIPDYLNSEQNKDMSLSRRDFIWLSATVLPVTLLALSIPLLNYFKYPKTSSKLYNWLFNNPRYVKNKKSSNAKSEVLKIEKQCLDLISKKQYGACVSILYPQVKKRIESNNMVKIKEAIRLSDLLVKTLLFLIYRKQETEFKNEFCKMIQLAKNSENQLLARRSDLWDQFDYKWLLVCKNPQSIIKWNKTIFMQ